MRFLFFVLLAVGVAMQLVVKPSSAQRLDDLLEPAPVAVTPSAPPTIDEPTNRDLAPDLLLAEPTPPDAPPALAQPKPEISASRIEPQDFETRVFRLNKLPADQAVATIQHLFSAEFSQGLRLDANPRGNVIVMRGFANWLESIEALLQKLDSMADENRGMVGAEADVTNWLQVPVNTWVEDNSSENELQRQIRRLALTYQSLTDQDSEEYDASGENAADIAEELRVVVQRAFDHRQQRQQEQIRRLQQRLAALQDQLSNGENRKRDAIDKMVTKLLSLGQEEGQTQRRLQRLLGAFAVTGVVREVPQTEPSSAPRSAASAPVTAPQGATAELERVRELFRKGYVSKDEYERAQANLSATQADLQTTIKRLELNLLEAESELEFSAAEYDEAKEANERLAGAVAQTQLRKLALRMRQAELKLQRAKLELEAAKKRSRQ